MILSPIRKVLSSIAQYEVRALLMGGQACISYGAAEFSRDIDFAILSSEESQIIEAEKALAVGMAEKAAEFKATGSEIYQGNVPDGVKEHH